VCRLLACRNFGLLLACWGVSGFLLIRWERLLLVYVVVEIDELLEVVLVVIHQRGADVASVDA